jgi:transposase
MNKVVGIDVSKDKLDVAVLDDRQQVEYSQVANSEAGYAQLKRWLKKRAGQGSAVCLEATGHYGEGVAQALYEAGYRMSVVNPARIRGYAQQPDAWTPPAPEIRQLQALVRHLATVEEAKQQVDNRLREAKSMPALVVEQLHAQQSLLVAQIDQLKRAIQDQIDHFPDLKRQRDLIKSIPGLGALTAAKLLAECRPLTDFTDVRQLVAFAGLNPSHHQSGSSIRKKTQISKTGNAAIRAALYMPAVVAQRFNPILRPFAQRLLDRGLCHMAVITAVMRKLLHLVFGILKSGRPFDPAFAS